MRVGAKDKTRVYQTPYWAWRLINKLLGDDGRYGHPLVEIRLEARRVGPWEVVEYV